MNGIPNSCGQNPAFAIRIPSIPDLFIPLLYEEYLFSVFDATCPLIQQLQTGSLRGLTKM